MIFRSLNALSGVIIVLVQSIIVISVYFYVFIQMYNFIFHFYLTLYRLILIPVDYFIFYYNYAVQHHEERCCYNGATEKINVFIIVIGRPTELWNNLHPCVCSLADWFIK